MPPEECRSDRRLTNSGYRLHPAEVAGRPVDRGRVVLPTVHLRQRHQFSVPANDEFPPSKNASHHLPVARAGVRGRPSSALDRASDASSWRAFRDQSLLHSQVQRWIYEPKGRLAENFHGFDFGHSDGAVKPNPKLISALTGYSTSRESADLLQGCRIGFKHIHRWRCPLACANRPRAWPLKLDDPFRLAASIAISIAHGCPPGKEA